MIIVRLDVSQIAGHKGASMPVEFSCALENVGDYPDVVKFLEPVEWKGQVTNTEGIFVVEGTVKTKVEMSCSRCLTPVAVDVFFKIDEKFSNTGSLDEETETFSGDSIDLAQVIKKGILFSLPMKVVCREDCAGLCPVCGKNLNEGDCGCDTSYINPKFEGLRSLFKVDEEV